jgi:hypothetical protein
MISRVAALCLMTAPAWAGCPDYLSFAKGVTVKLEDGSVLSVRRDAHEVIRADQTNATDHFARYVIGPYGVYPTESTRNGHGAISEYSYARTPPEPVAGMDWTSNVRAVTTLIGAAPEPQRREKVHVTVGDVQRVTIGRCAYQALEIDMGHLGGPNPTVQHFTYFPDLRFGIQTRITYPKDTVKKAAVLALTAQERF